ncbi:DUF2306 domain-containing protein [Fodinicola acaciae]|uniref:DUF2306 domain-containing protein n=1 Tax=Fodinicola acaciae TaxID=2681555 RepID=UPI0013D69719|nr:DUF2306 domain-containing protein [Fodinicola acaciae]
MTTTVQGKSIAAGPRRSWWRRPWIVPLALLALLFLAFSLPPYATLNPALSRVPSSFPLHYPLLVAHVGFATVAMVTCCFQVWPWFRQHYPVAHRWLGRTYVFAGVLPAGLCGLIIGAGTPFGLVAAGSDISLALLWLFCTMAGYRMARRRRFADHRRWMIRSFALTFSIITNRIWGIILFIVFLPQATGPEAAQQIGPLGAWLGWTTVLLFTEWWLVERRKA